MAATLAARQRRRGRIDRLRALVAIVALVVLVRRGTPADVRGSALTAGIAAAAWGCAVFTVACPSDDPLYVVGWFAAAMAFVAAIARVVVPRLTRW